MSVNLFLRKSRIKLLKDEIRGISRIAGHRRENKLSHEFNGDEKTLDAYGNSAKRAKKLLETCTNVPY